MTDPIAEINFRLYGMMQWLMSAAAAGTLPQEPAPRSVVTRDDALDAVLQLAAVIDQATQDGLIPQAMGLHAAAVLMVIREYIKPLPHGGQDPAEDHVTPDLQELVKVLRREGGAAGIQG